MIQFEEPKIQCLKVDRAQNYGEFVYEPLERGYGITIGNSLRRILLSSLPGCAIKNVKMNGATHEFTTLPNVVEDVPEIILNLKMVRLRDPELFKHLKDDDTVKFNLRIDVEGPKEVTAKDIITDGTCEVLNPELHIATVSDGGTLQMEMTANIGRGYNTADKNKDPNDPIGVIAIDSIYSPVKKVNYTVENTRVGQRIDYDKLTIRLWTDGSLAPYEALSYAAKTMSEHLKLIVNLSDQVRKTEIMAEKPKEEENKELEIPIEELGLSVRSFNCLKRAGISTLGDIVEMTENDMMKVKNLGKKSLEEVMQKIQSRGLSLKQDDK